MSPRTSLKEINTYKKRLNWGDIPPFFHLVSNALADLQGLQTHGFDSAYKRLMDRRNWNVKRLGGRETMNHEIYVDRKPEIVVHRRFVGRNYEVHCMPIKRDEPVVLFSKDDPEVDFKLWDPTTMQCLIKLPDFVEFMQMAFTRGDEADQLLVEFASDLVENTLREIHEEVRIVSLKGYSIKSIIERIQKEGI